MISLRASWRRIKENFFDRALDYMRTLLFLKNVINLYNLEHLKIILTIF